MYFQQFPLLRLVICFAIGIALSHFIPDKLNYSVFVIAILLVLLYLLNWRYSLRFNLFFGLLTLLLFMQLGVYRLERKVAADDQHQLLNQDLSQVQAYKALLISWPERTERSYKLEVNAIGTYNGDQWLPVDGKVLLYTDTLTGKGLSRGDIIWVGAAPTRTQAPANPFAFDYRNYLSFQNIHFQQYERDIQKLGHYPVSWLWRLTHRVRTKAEATLRRYLADDRSYAIALALVLGQKGELDAEISQAYSASGAMHVLAVSGLHVGLIYLVFTFFYQRLPERFKRSRWLEAALSILLLLSYAFLTGLSPSVLRAVTMFSFMAIGKATGKKSSIYNSLAASAMVLLILDPHLLFNVGFQLSYAAVVGIVYLQPKLYQLVTCKQLVWDKLWAIASVSIAAQLATAPLSLYYFHQFPTYFLITNLFAIPAAFLMLFIGLLLLVASVLPPLAALLGALLSFLIQLTNSLVTAIGNLPFGQLGGVYFSISETLLLYGVLFSLVLLFSLRKFRMIYPALLLSVVFSLGRLQASIQALNETELVVFQIPNAQAVHLRKGNAGYLISNSQLLNDVNQLAFHVTPYLSFYGLEDDVQTLALRVPMHEIGRAKFLVFEGKKIVMLSKEAAIDQLPKEIAWDLCITEGHDHISIIEAKEFVLNSRSYGGFQKELKNDRIHSTFKSGYFTMTW